MCVFENKKACCFCNSITGKEFFVSNHNSKLFIPVYNMCHGPVVLVITGGCQSVLYRALVTYVKTTLSKIVVDR